MVVLEAMNGIGCDGGAVAKIMVMTIILGIILTLGRTRKFIPYLKACESFYDLLYHMILD